MDFTTSFSTASLVDKKDVVTVINEFEDTWVNHFRYPLNIEVDTAFEEGEFKMMLNNSQSSFSLHLLAVIL